MPESNPILSGDAFLLQNYSEHNHIKNSRNKSRFNNKNNTIENNESGDENVYNKGQKGKIIKQDRFLNDNKLVQDCVKVVKKPVAKPRKNKLEQQRRDSSSSSGTFNVTSPKVLFKIGSSNLDTTNDYIKINNGERKCDSSDKIESDSNPSITKSGLIHLSYSHDKDISDTSEYEYEHENNKKSNKKCRSIKLKKRTVYNTSSSRPGSSICSEAKHDDIIASADGNKHQYDYQTITEVIIHKSDRLLLNSFVIHPVVKVHVVDMRNGKYFRKSDKNRSVTFYYENENNNYIMPVISNSYNLQENRSFYPKWEEGLIFNEDFKYFVNKNVIIFFEIMDFSTSNIEILKKNKEYQKGWYKIAFAFLIVAGKDSPHVHKKLQLQLYYIMNTKKLEPDYCELWGLWNEKKFKKYPSSLYVTIRSMIAPTRVTESFRSKTPLQKEVIANVEDSADQRKAVEKIEKETFEMEIKLKDINQKRNLLPDDSLLEIESYDDGCFVLKFSNDGKYLACSTHLENEFYIIIYSVKDFERKLRYHCQESLIYSIVWSDDDQYLLSTSSDKTLLIWNVKTNMFQQVLHHPSFVYTSDINCENILATGCYDQTIRIWTLNSTSKKYELFQELKKHNGFVTSICFTKKLPMFLYSADSQGEIYEWNYNSDKWIVNRLLDIIDLRGIKINQIVLFPDEKRILVHSRDSALRIISIQSSCVIHWLYGALNLRIQTFCSISHNGLLVASGSENGLVLIWNANTGKVLKTLEGFSKTLEAVHCVHFNTKMNMLAFSHYGTKKPIIIYGSNENDAKRIDCYQPKNNGNCTENFEILNYRDILKKMDSLLV